jgi:hypothetical protein
MLLTNGGSKGPPFVIISSRGLVSVLRYVAWLQSGKNNQRHVTPPGGTKKLDW